MKQQQEINIKELREFGLVTSIMIGLMFGLLLPWLFSSSYHFWPWVTSIILSGWALFRPIGLRSIYKVWMKVGQVLGTVNTRIILGVMFYFMIFPVGVLMRLIGHDPMRRHCEPKMKSYRVQSVKPPQNHLERPF